MKITHPAPSAGHEVLHSCRSVNSQCEMNQEFRNLPRYSSSILAKGISDVNYIKEDPPWDRRYIQMPRYTRKRIPPQLCPQMENAEEKTVGWQYCD
jgi:hypothetical protein